MNAAAGQEELFPAWRYHAVFTDSPFEMIQAEEHHRDHAIIEQVFADWNDGPLAHLPSGSFAANAAWLACAAISCNLLRAAQRRHGQPRLRRARAAPPPCAATSSASQPGPPATAAVTSPCTCHAAWPAGTDRMAEPVRGSLRGAPGQRGLTNPERVSPAQARSRPPQPASHQDIPHKRERRHKLRTRHPSKITHSTLAAPTGNDHAIYAVDRG